ADRGPLLRRGAAPAGEPDGGAGGAARRRGLRRSVRPGGGRLAADAEGVGGRPIPGRGLGLGAARVLRAALTRGGQRGGELIVTGDRRRMDPERPRADAMAVRDGRILAVGSRDDALAALPGADVRSAPGTVVPGLIDAHVHTLIAGLELRRLDVSDATSVA